VPQSQLTTVKGGDKLDFPGFSVEVIESRHGWLGGKPPRQENVEITGPLGRPIIGRDFVDGGSLLYYFTFGKHRVLHQSTANFVEEKLAGLQPDVVLFSVGHDGYDLERVLKTLKPKVIVIQHFDEWRAPFSEGIQDRSAKRAERFKRDIAKIDSTIKVIIPHFFMTYTLE
jgi:L-ascorbate metabolism protein UlaG (beta-lactamase superfamily)